MYTVIFAGGQGTRISEETKRIPKPMIKIGSKTIIEHIMSTYIKCGFNKFIVLTGYKHQKFFSYFKEKKIFFLTNEKKNFLKENFKYKKLKKKIYLNLFFTGNNTNKRQRLLKVKKILAKEKFFFLTYGDGVSNINLKKLIKYHSSHGKICTLSGVNPNSRYGLLELAGNKVTSFKEKKKIKDKYVNAGFFACKTDIFKYLEKEKGDFEDNVLPNLSKKNQLRCYKHKSFWHCIDTLRDKTYLEKLKKKI
jgi:glucose-1-phosphate cytidylyltransferase